MLGNLRGFSPSSETMSEGTLERNRAEKALITKTPTQSQVFVNKCNVKNYSDRNGNDVSKNMSKGRKTFAFWTLVCLLFILAIGNLVLTFTILAVLRLGQGMESMEFLPEHNAIKFFGNTGLENIYKRDGLLESFRDTPMQILSENGSVTFNLQTRLSRSDTKLVVNSSGVFVRGVSAVELRDPDSGEVVFSSAAPEMTLPEGVNNLHAKQISTKRVASPINEDLTLRSEGSAHLRGAEGTHMESKELFWSADQDIYLKSINGSIVLSGKEGVYIDVRYLPIALPVNKTDKQSGQFKVCVCMPEGKLFRIPVPTGQKITCEHVNVTDLLNPIDISYSLRRLHRPILIRRFLVNPYHPEDGDLTENLSSPPDEENSGEFHLRGEISSLEKKETDKSLRINGRMFKVVTNKTEFVYSD